MIIFGRGSALKWWHPDAEPFKWDYRQFGWYLDEFTELVPKWVRPAGDGSGKTVLCPDPEELKECLDHPFIEWMIYRYVARFVRLKNGANGSLAERLASDIWSELALLLARGVRYQHGTAWQFHNWFSCVMYHISVGVLGRELSKAEAVAPEVLDALFAPVVDLDEQLDFPEKLAATLEAVMDLLPRQRQVVLGLLAGEGVESIARELGVSCQVVYRVKYQALDALRLVLAPKYQVVWC